MGARRIVSKGLANYRIWGMEDPQQGPGGVPDQR